LESNWRMNIVLSGLSNGFWELMARFPALGPNAYLVSLYPWANPGLTVYVMLWNPLLSDLRIILGSGGIPAGLHFPSGLVVLPDP